MLIFFAYKSSKPLYKLPKATPSVSQMLLQGGVSYKTELFVVKDEISKRDELTLYLAYDRIYVLKFQIVASVASIGRSNIYENLA